LLEEFELEMEFNSDMRINHYLNNLRQTRNKQASVYIVIKATKNYFMSFIESISIFLFAVTLSMNKSFSQIKSDTTFVVNDPYKSTTPEWIIIAYSDDGDKWYMKSEYVNKERGNIKIWIKFKSISSTIKKKIYKNTEDKWLLIVDCDNKKIKILSTVTYSSSGKVIDNETILYPDYDDVIPDTVMERIREKICSHFNK